MVHEKFTNAAWGFLCALFIATGVGASAQPSIQLDVLQFQTLTEPYVEVQLEIPSALLPLVNADGGWRCEGEVTCILEQAGGIASYAKGRLIGPVYADSAAARSGEHFHVERLVGAVGGGRVTVQVAGAEAAVDVRLPALDVPHFSSPMLVEAYGPAAEDSPFAHSGVDLLPVVGARVGFDAPEIRYYLELYGVGHVPDSLIYIANWLEDGEGVELAGSRVYHRVLKGQIAPVFTTRPWGAEAARARSMVWEAVSKTAGPLCREQLRLAAPQGGSASDELLPFARRWTDRDSLLRHLQDHQPLANPSQQRLIRDVLPNAKLEAMQGFLDQFWRTQSPENPALGYAEYVEAIAHVNEQYGSCYAGHGADSEMGYVYLRYGKPTTVVQRHNETEYYPYEIWHYYRAGNFSDKRFLFYSPHMVAECFRLLHSDMLGEVSNQDWLTILRNRENNLRVTESQLNSSNPRDSYSREEPEDLFFNPR